MKPGSNFHPRFAIEFKNTSHKCYLVNVLTCVQVSGDSKKNGKVYCTISVWERLYSKIRLISKIILSFLGKLLIIIYSFDVFQIMWARQLAGANKSYQILTIGESTHINDNRFLIPKSTVNNVRSTQTNNCLFLLSSLTSFLNLSYLL